MGVDGNVAPPDVVAELLTDEQWFKVEIVTRPGGYATEAVTGAASAFSSRVTSLVNFSLRILLGWAEFAPPREGEDDECPLPPVPTAQVDSEVFTGGLDMAGVAPVRVAGFASGAVAPVYWLRGVPKESWARVELASEGAPAGAVDHWEEAWFDPRQAVARAPEREQSAVRESLEAAGLDLSERVPVRVSGTLDTVGGVRIEVGGNVSRDHAWATWSLGVVSAPPVEADIRQALSTRTVGEVVQQFLGAPASPRLRG